MEEKKEKSSQFPYLPLIRGIRDIRGKKNPPPSYSVPLSVIPPSAGPLSLA